jgi:hypothetical protein
MSLAAQRYPHRHDAQQDELVSAPATARVADAPAYPNALIANPALYAAIEALADHTPDTE